MTEHEQLMLDGVLRNEPFICCQDGFAYFLGPEAPNDLTWQDAINWCKSLGDYYELPSKYILNACYENKSIRKEFVPYWYWSSTVHYKYADCAWSHYFYDDIQSYYGQALALFVRAVRKIKI